MSVSHRKQSRGDKSCSKGSLGSCSTACMNMALLQWEAENMALNILTRLLDQDFILKRNGIYAHVGAGLDRLIPETNKRVADGG